MELFLFILPELSIFCKSPNDSVTIVEITHVKSRRQCLSSRFENTDDLNTTALGSVFAMQHIFLNVQYTQD